VPLSGGLGSSAAAYVAGLVAAAHVLELDEDLLAHATELEGHPDNAAAALLGGFVIVTGGDVARFEAPDGLEAVIVVPRSAVRTAVARKALPQTVPLADAVANVAHGALLTLGLCTGDLSLVGRGLHDRLHQPYRAHLFPESMKLLARARELGAIGATISGAGPTVLFWTHADATGAVVGALRRETQGWADVLRAPFQTQGADVREL
jgi:homoserine kinase